MEQDINTAPLAEKPMWEIEEWAEDGMKKAMEILNQSEHCGKGANDCGR
jgi:hypothetical protein